MPNGFRIQKDANKQFLDIIGLPHLSLVQGTKHGFIGSMSGGQGLLILYRERGFITQDFEEHVLGEMKKVGLVTNGPAIIEKFRSFPRMQKGKTFFLRCSSAECDKKHGVIAKGQGDPLYAIESLSALLLVCIELSETEVASPTDLIAIMQDAIEYGVPQEPAVVGALDIFKHSARAI